MKPDLPNEEAIRAAREAMENYQGELANGKAPQYPQWAADLLKRVAFPREDDHA